MPGLLRRGEAVGKTAWEALPDVAESRFEAGLRPFFTYRDLGIHEATGGSYGAHVIRAVPGQHAEPHWHTHDLTFQMVYILKG